MKLNLYPVNQNTIIEHKKLTMQLDIQRSLEDKRNLVDKIDSLLVQILPNLYSHMFPMDMALFLNHQDNNNRLDTSQNLIRNNSVKKRMGTDVNYTSPINN